MWKVYDLLPHLTAARIVRMHKHTYPYTGAFIKSHLQDLLSLQAPLIAAIALSKGQISEGWELNVVTAPALAVFKQVRHITIKLVSGAVEITSLRV